MSPRLSLRPRPAAAGAGSALAVVFVFVVAAALALAPAPARANGAFPGSLRVFVPPGAPEQILLATNFGVISTADGGGRWEWLCEHGDGLLAGIYEMGPGPRPRLYAAGPVGFAVSEDSACSWKAHPEMQAATLTGIFADPGDADRVWVVARPRLAAPADGFGLYLSRDGGATFGPPRYQVPLGATIDSVESARSRPQRLYLTVSGGSLPRVEIVRSDDGGTTFTAVDVTAPSRGDQLRIAAVDPEDPERLYLRAQGFPDERLVISRDGGRTIADALVIERGRLTAFVRRAGGELVAGGISDTEGGRVHVSSDGGASFALRSTAIRPGALAERAGLLWASTDNLLDGFALARSADATTWEPVARYRDVVRTRTCPGSVRLDLTCSAACIQEVVRGVFDASACPTNLVPGPRPDAAPVAPADGGGGCGCHLGPGGRGSAGRSGAGGLLALALGALGGVGAARRRRRARVRPPRPR